MTDATPAEIASRMQQIAARERAPEVLALDVATVTGWARGKPGAQPTSGSIRFASAGASKGAIYNGCLMWAIDFLTPPLPDLIVIEQPLSFMAKIGKTNADAVELLHVLPGIIRAVAYQRGIYDWRSARVDVVRHHFIGSNPKGDEGKYQTVRKCRALCWDPKDDDAADALATWDYQCSLIDPVAGLRTSPLFNKQLRVPA
jgi:hypothetical protein